MKSSTDVFQAIAHPTRRQLLEELAGGEQPVNSLAAPFAMSRPAVSQHLRVLLDAGLVAERRVGRERYYRLQPGSLRAVHEWVNRYDGFWTDRLGALGEHLERQPD